MTVIKIQLCHLSNDLQCEQAELDLFLRLLLEWNLLNWNLCRRNHKILGFQNANVCDLSCLVELYLRAVSP